MFCPRLSTYPIKESLLVIVAAIVRPPLKL